MNAGPLRYFAIRLLLVALLLGLAEYWVSVHFGVPFIETVKEHTIATVISLVIAIGLLAYAARGGAVAESVNAAKEFSDAHEAAENIFKARLGKAARFILRFDVLIVLAFLFFVVTLFRSSIKVSAAALPASSRVSVILADATNNVASQVIQAEKDVLFSLWTRPSGQTYQVSAEGYSAIQSKVVPWKQTAIVLGETLPAEPTIVLRLHHRQLATGAGNRIELKRSDSGEILAAATLTDERHGGLLLGFPRPISGLEAAWREQLVAVNYPRSAQDSAIEQWRNLVAARVSAPLATTNTIQVILTKVNGNTFTNTFRVTKNLIQDIVIAEPLN